MKYLFAREDKNQPGEAASAESVFCTAAVPQSLEEDLRRAEKAMEETVRSALPPALQTIKTFSMCLALIFLTAVLRALTNVAPEQAYHNAPALFWIGVTAVVIWLACWIYTRTQLKRLETDEQLGADIESAAKSVRDYLDIPEKTDKIDVLSFHFRKDKSGLRFQGNADNSQVEFYRQNDALCLFDGLRVYSLPLEGASLHVLKLGVPVNGERWNKTEGPGSKKYRKYGVTLLYDSIQRGLSYCCALELVHEGEPYRMLFPAYEWKTLKRLTGLPAPNLPKIEKGKPQAELERADDFSWSSEPLRPHYTWRLPKEDAKAFFSLSSDEEFRVAHPKAFGILVGTGIAALFLPCLIFTFAAGRAAGSLDNAWILLGTLGGFVFGMGLFNLVAAWLRQYLGHIFTLICLLLGGGMMAFTWFFLL